MTESHGPQGSYSISQYPYTSDDSPTKHPGSKLNAPLQINTDPSQREWGL